MNFFNTSLS
jgi:hypothetical protein